MMIVAVATDRGADLVSHRPSVLARLATDRGADLVPLIH